MNLVKLLCRECQTRSVGSLLAGTLVFFLASIPVANMDQPRFLADPDLVRGKEKTGFSCVDACSNVVLNSCTNTPSCATTQTLGAACGFIATKKYSIQQCIKDPAGIVTCGNDGSGF